jgi:ribosomal protein L37AE/L43A
MLLEEKHQEVVKEILQKHRTRKSCNKCYDRGFTGWTAEKTLIPCEKCVDIEAAMAEWKEYVKADEALKEDFKELFEDDSTEGDTTDKPETTDSDTEAKPEIVEVKDEVPAKPKKKKEASTTKAKTTKAAPAKTTVPRRSGKRSS